MSSSGNGADTNIRHQVAMLRRRSQQALWEKSASIVQRRGRLVLDAASSPVDLFSQAARVDSSGDLPPAA